MDPALGREADTVDFFAELARTPYRLDFYQTLRRLECLYGHKPRWGRALRPVDEPVRLGQDPDLAFAPSALSSFESADGAIPRLQVRLFGLFGPNGPLPMHLTEYARERLRHHADGTLCRFLDIFHHRFIALFYRAWAQAQPHVNYDRPKDDRFATYVGAFLGIAPEVPNADYASALKALAENPGYAEKARDFAKRYAGHSRTAALATMIGRIEAVLPSSSR